MNVRCLKKFGIILGSAVLACYLAFLILPFCLTQFVNGYIPQINKIVEDSSGLKSEIKNIKIITSPNLSIGFSVEEFNLFTPKNEEIIDADNFKIRMSLLPLLCRKIELDTIALNSFKTTLNLNKDGSFEIEKYFPVTEAKSEEQSEQFSLPLGLKLSNTLPDILLGKYEIKFVDNSTRKNYIIQGEKIEITDFTLNKSINAIINSKMILNNREQFNCDIKLSNKIMPDINLNDLIFNTQEKPQEEKTDTTINILSIFKEIYKSKVTASINTDLKLNKNNYNGYANFEKLSIAPSGLALPESNIKLSAKGKTIKINSELYTAKNEASKIEGTIQTGKNNEADINISSNASLANIVNIANAFAESCGIKDLKSLSAKGNIDTDFNIKTDFKKSFTSNGYFKIPSAEIHYKQYNIDITKISTDIEFDNNNIEIKTCNFSILNQPSRIYGKIKNNLDVDLHLAIQSLNLKQLLILAGQNELLKENPISSGTVSLYANLKDNINNLKTQVKFALSNLNLKNTPSNTSLLVPQCDVDMEIKDNNYTGDALIVGVKVVNPCATVTMPRTIFNINKDEIKLEPSNMSVDKINLELSGKITDYLTEKMQLDFLTTKDINSSITGNINTQKQTLDVLFSAPQNCTIVIPMFNKSKMTFNGKTKISGNLFNPNLSGAFNVEKVSIPEIPVEIENLIVKLNGEILNGNMSASKFASGGIVAEKISSAFSMKGENFYMKNLNGNAFDGSFSGDIIYNLSNAKTTINFIGKNMDAEKAIEGASGIKKALTGKLNFDTKLNLKVVDYNEMLKSMTGNFNFKISKGHFISIGRLENFLNAANIASNSILKNTVQSLSNVGKINDTANYDYIEGSLTFSNGWANFSQVKSAGKSLAYYVTGKYNILNGTTSMVVLGRLDNDVVSMLGALGDLSVDKICANIPKFGSLTSVIIKNLTANPNKENIANLPALSNEKATYKDFKVVFNGGIDKQSSVKSFQWLTNTDTTELEKINLKESLNTVKSSVKADADNVVNSAKELQNTVKQQQEAAKASAEELKQSVLLQKEEFKNSIEGFKTIFKTESTEN